MSVTEKDFLFVHLELLSTHSFFRKLSIQQVIRNLTTRSLPFFFLHLSQSLSSRKSFDATMSANANSTIIIGVLKETVSGENRVAIPPLVAADLIKKGYHVFVEEKAGARAGFGDQQYKDCRCMVASKEQVISESHILFCIDADTDAFESMSGKVLVAWVGRLLPDGKRIVEHAKNANITLMDITALPRITIAQPFDFLSSQAVSAGGRAFKEAFQVLGREEEHANTVLVLGCGVAGMQSIRAAKRHGFLVRAWDVLNVREQVEALGGSWASLPDREYADSQAFKKAQIELFADITKESDIVITTAAIPGRISPLLITDDMVKAMKPGSIIVDLAAVGGGNCSMTKKDEKYTTDNGITIIGYTNMASRDAKQASLSYGKNVYNLLEHITGEKGPSKFFAALDSAFVTDETGNILGNAHQQGTFSATNIIFPVPDMVIRNITCTRDGQALNLMTPPSELAKCMAAKPNTTPNAKDVNSNKYYVSG
eukprot:gene806-418_t